ncbi:MULTISPECIES: asparagine synthase (glutamine-hydrolyzing) [Cyanophyceae]|uniref:asparagine synthase (glutamine-hydrolyzing) n=1 Tax=Cyanophyceae TaxID=3028117 RepID=UPI00168A2C0E|nr:asparagine synthase (glutamine-hydrolyzing) [Trichocoleus sp. FACHB-40]MBD2002393.1 asparagine synthase (glutamine-hydrolyzing) [Trichocoleus sp. FACHB-40]
MCGIAGFWDTSQEISTDKMQAIAQKMSDTLLTRGPDDGGVWVDAAAGIALGHRRLAIVDLSPEGHQPMVSGNGRYVIVFNGEIYNYLELRRELEQLGHRFRGHSDTEVMLASFSQWGLEAAVQRFNGMFAFALWDRKEQVLHLGRDRIGEKPLYYGWIDNTFLFASELKALKAYPHFSAEINRDALALFLRYSCIPAPYSIYQGIYKLPPAKLLTWNGSPTRPDPVPYWCLQEVAELGVANPFPGTSSEAVAKLDALLQDAVALRRVADVPLGAFLSGGIDSSTVVAIMQAQSSQPVKTFTIGFYENAYNEAQYAKAVAQHIGTDHTELYVTPKEAIAVVPKLPTLYDEPFADSSQIPTFLVSQVAKQHVTVSLSGDGGDELFAGYNRYPWVRQIWQRIGFFPQSWRQAVANALTARSPQAWNRDYARLEPLLPNQLRQRLPGYKMHTLATILASASPEAMYQQLVCHWQAPESVVVGAKKIPTILTVPQQWAKLPDYIQQMMYLDTVTYLPDDILTKVDRASMGLSLEVRVPFLDHRVIEFAWQIPLSLKIHQGQSKWLLRQVLYKYVPKSLIERPKMGFAIPIDKWLRGELRDWAETLLDETRLRQEGFFHPQPIRQKWAEYLSGDRNWQEHLWDILMFQAWLQEQKNS